MSPLYDGYFRIARTSDPLICSGGQFARMLATLLDDQRALPRKGTMFSLRVLRTSRYSGLASSANRLG